MIKAVIFDMDNTLLDFMKMKRAAVESAVERAVRAARGRDGIPGLAA